MCVEHCTPQCAVCLYLCCPGCRGCGTRFGVVTEVVLRVHNPPTPHGKVPGPFRGLRSCLLRSMLRACTPFGMSSILDPTSNLVSLFWQFLCSLSTAKRDLDQHLLRTYAAFASQLPSTCSADALLRRHSGRLHLDLCGYDTSSGRAHKQLQPVCTIILLIVCGLLHSDVSLDVPWETMASSAALLTLTVSMYCSDPHSKHGYCL